MQPVVVIGAGVGGLAAALDLAAAGLDVTVLERAAGPGGKLAASSVGGVAIDTGPTVFTMRWVFEALFAAAGTTLDAQFTLQPARVLARHAWSATERLDLHADIDCSAEAIGAFAGAAEARGYREFCARARRIYRTLQDPFIRADRPSMLTLVRAAGLREIAGIAPFATLWRALGEHFCDPRLRQLFGRYATYCGASPFLAPATLMLVAHVEQDGVWLVEGGMHRIAAALAAVATGLGARCRYGSEVAAIETQAGRVAGVRLATGERIEAGAVVLNADAAALAAGLFGGDFADTVPRVAPAQRSLSALTWTMLAEAEGFPLARHTVFFSADYKAEFDQIAGGRLPAAPTVYVCAQDRDGTGAGAAGSAGAERLLCLVNAPATGDTHRLDPTEIAACESATFGLLERCGLTLRRRPEAIEVTTPADFHRRFPATGGALYGAATHGPLAAFRRPGARTPVPGLYLAGGSVHPGPGVPMAALSGRMAAACLLADRATTALVSSRRASTGRSRAMATPGGMSTR